MIKTKIGIVLMALGMATANSDNLLIPTVLIAMAGVLLISAQMNREER